MEIRILLQNRSLKLKAKGFETKKESISIKELNNLNLLSLDNLKTIQEILNFKLKQKKVIYPVLTTHYEREYFISLNGKIRATVDYNLKSIFLNNLSQIYIIKNFKNICILEFKYPTSLDKYVRKNLRDVSLRLSKNSKFVNSAFEKPKFFS